MLRDIPKIYLIFLAFGIGMMISIVSYTKAFVRGGDTLALNDIVLTSAVSEVGQKSRLAEGTLILEDTFEEKSWVQIEDKYAKGSEVEFDYLFDDVDANGNYPQSTSDTYTVGGSKIPKKNAIVFADRPVKAIRIKVRESGDNVTANKVGWTYTSTVKLDVAED